MGLLQDIFGSKPKVPSLKPIDYAQVQKDATQQNIDVAPKADDLAKKYNALSQAELDQLLNANIPDLAGIKKNISSKLLAESAGQLSPDVQDAVERSAVARSLGFAGGSMGGAWVARDIGRTSYDISNQALASTDRWLQTTRNYLTPQPFNIASMFVSPQQRLAQVTEERNLQFEHDWLQNQIKAMPDPVAHAVWLTIHQIGMKALGFAMGGGMGGGGGGGGGSDTSDPGKYPQFPQYNWQGGDPGTGAG